MIPRKTVMKALLAMFISMAIAARSSIWYYLQPLPAWWKLLIALIVAAFVTVAFIFSCGMEGLLFRLLNLKFQ